MELSTTSIYQDPLSAALQQGNAALQEGKINMIESLMDIIYNMGQQAQILKEEKAKLAGENRVLKERLRVLDATNQEKWTAFLEASKARISAVQAKIDQFDDDLDLMYDSLHGECETMRKRRNAEDILTYRKRLGAEGAVANFSVYYVKDNPWDLFWGYYYQKDFKATCGKITYGALQVVVPPREICPTFTHKYATELKILQEETTALKKENFLIEQEIHHFQTQFPMVLEHWRLLDKDRFFDKAIKHSEELLAFCDSYKKEWDAKFTAATGWHDRLDSNGRRTQILVIKVKINALLTEIQAIAKETQ